MVLRPGMGAQIYSIMLNSYWIKVRLVRYVPASLKGNRLEC